MLSSVRVNSDPRRWQDPCQGGKETERLKDKTEGLQGKITGNYGTSSKREDSWHKKVCARRQREREDVAGQRYIGWRREDIVREYKVMYEEHVLSSWLREDVEGIEERRKDRQEKAREDESRSGERKVERSFEELSLVDDLGGFGNILVKKYWVTLVVFRSVCLWFRRVCL